MSRLSGFPYHLKPEKKKHLQWAGIELTFFWLGAFAARPRLPMNDEQAITMVSALCWVHFGSYKAGLNFGALLSWQVTPELAHLIKNYFFPNKKTSIHLLLLSMIKEKSTKNHIKTFLSCTRQLVRASNQLPRDLRLRWPVAAPRRSLPRGPGRTAQSSAPSLPSEAVPGSVPLPGSPCQVSLLLNSWIVKKTDDWLRIG